MKKQHNYPDGKNILYDGSEVWSKNGLWHREDGPAVIYSNGDKYWMVNGERHREDGPAVELNVKLCGRRYYWYYRGKYINCHLQEEFEKLVKLKAFW